jgi:acetamidase/formamidase
MLAVGADRPHGFFDPDLAPVATVEPGETVRFATLESGWSPEPFDIADPAARPRHPAWTEGSGHALTGPVAVRGARAGQVLEIRVDAVRRAAGAPRTRTPGRPRTTSGTG